MSVKSKANANGSTRRRFMKNAAGAVAGAAVLSGAAPGILRGTAHASDEVQIGYLPVNVMLPVYEESVGFWRDAGLNASLFRAAGGPAILQALATGSVPVGDIGVGPAIIAAIRGLPFYYVTLASVMTPDHPLDRIMVLEDSPIQEFADLRGKALAINQRGTMPDAALGAAEQKFGLAKSDIDLVPIPYPNMAQVLTQGQVDAIYPFPPADAVAEVRFGARTVANTTDFAPYIGFTTLAVHRDFADENPEMVQKLVQGAINGHRWNNDNQAEARSASNSFLSIPEDVGPSVRTAYWTRNGLPVMANVWHLYELQVAGGIIEPVDGIEDVINDYFVEPTQRFTLPALEEVGFQADPTIKEMLQGEYPLLPKPVEEYHTEWDRQILSM